MKFVSKMRSQFLADNENSEATDTFQIQTQLQGSILAERKAKSDLGIQS